MPLGAPKPTLASFLQCAGWTVSRAMLSKIGSAKHDIRFVLLQEKPYILRYSNDPFDDFKGINFIRRTIDFGRIGIICVSGTSPSLREIVLTATISRSSPLFFKMDTTQPAPPSSDEHETGKSRTFRVDFTKIDDRYANDADLLVLSGGRIVYPLSTARDDVFYKSIYDSHAQQMYADSVPLSILSQAEITEVKQSYKSLGDNITLDLAMLLDSEELLAFHWTSETGKFSEDYYNAGLTSAP